MPQITKRVYPHLLRHSVATTLLERGMPIEQIQKFLGHCEARDHADLRRVQCGDDQGELSAGVGGVRDVHYMLSLWMIIQPLRK